MSPQPWLDSAVSAYHNKKQSDTYVLKYIDFFYTLANYKTFLIQGAKFEV